MLEKRKIKRIPIIEKFGELIEMKSGNKTLPGVILDLSSEGVSLLTLTGLPVGAEVSLTINLPDLKTAPMMGKVVWSEKKGELFRTGILISHIDSLDAKRINRMAIDYTDCENKIALGATDVCGSKCSYFTLCDKPQKIR